MELIKQNSQTKIFKNLALIYIGTIALTISAKIKIPFYPVPMTMQTFVVLLLGLSFGYKIGLSAVGLYLLEGIVGLPVFSNSPERGIGLVYFTGPTMGYLLGFLFTVYFAGSLNFNGNIFSKLLKLTFSVSFIYVLGLSWLGILIGWEKPLFQLGAQPFLLAELFKILIVLFSLNSLQKLNRYLK